MRKAVRRGFSTGVAQLKCKAACSLCRLVMFATISKGLSTAGFVSSHLTDPAVTVVLILGYLRVVFVALCPLNWLIASCIPHSHSRNFCRVPSVPLLFGYHGMLCKRVDVGYMQLALWAFALFTLPRILSLFPLAPPHS